MKKAELIEKIAESSGESKSAVQRVVDATFNEITEALKNDDSINITGFGTFKLSHRAARKGRNPQTGEEVDIPAKRSASFKAGQPLKDL